MKLLKLFFGKFFWWGLILILGSCILDMTFGEGFWKEVVVSSVSTFGVALMLGAIFDFSRNTEEFTGFISGIIRETMITKDFLGTLTDEEKKNVLKTVVIPRNSELKKYCSINNYYERTIDNFIDLGEKPFKTNLTINFFI